MIVAVLQLRVDVDILDVEAGQVGEYFILLPGQLYGPVAGQIIGNFLHFPGILQVIHGIAPLQIIRNMGHFKALNIHH